MHDALRQWQSVEELVVNAARHGDLSETLELVASFTHADNHIMRELTQWLECIGKP